ncbi:biofilm development regulator YmgB/AriR family protein [Erwinia sp. MMLR14_017]|uniref:biofilm development regulator YmgB/AriR family protein n=1 Tax=Erwinia sp. MMLR14_017 TaxID=3093842 RepID=UPI0029907BE1|nr:biofilm development regulator YmgB/AriR family protein [Erwinia sp. MMLR14_017]MDW8844964.1 biofilm development regulator YmgB/AriR family protein [Erwinia sp. MMLR14_017]
MAKQAFSGYSGQESGLFHDEKQIAGSIIHHQISTCGHVTNKTITLRLIEMLETADNAEQQHMLRNALELIVSQTAESVRS